MDGTSEIIINKSIVWLQVKNTVNYLYDSVQKMIVVTK